MNRIIYLVLLCLPMLIKGQDQHFTQFFAAPQTLNPSLAGAFSGNYRIGGVYRNQGSEFLDNPYTTFALAFDLRFSPSPRTKLVKDAFGAGITFYNDQVPGFDFSTNQMNISFAYHKSLGRANDQFLSAGFQAGIAQRNINYENLTFQDQFNGTTGYDIPTGEELPPNNFSFADYSIGLNYAFIPKGAVAIYAGAALHHFNEPQVSFFFDKRVEEEERRGDNALLTKTTAYLALQIPLGRSVQLHPRGLFYKQGEHIAMNAGSNFRFLLSESAGTAMHIGGWARPVRYEDGSFNLDAAILMAGFELSNVLFGLSYDAHLNSINRSGRRQGALEISIAYLGNYQNETVLCPSF